MLKSHFGFGLSDVRDMSTRKVLKAVMLPLVALAAATLAGGANAVPVDYSVVYTSSSAGQSGTGSFSFDSDTSAFSSFSWDLASGTDMLMANNWRASIFGGTMGRFLFEILTGEDVHPAACTANSRCTFSSANITSNLLTSIEFRTLATGMTEYLFRNGSTLLFNGTLSVNRVQIAQAVSEPFTLGLLGIGLLGIGLRRRKAK